MENKTAMNTLIDTLKLHEVLMKECPEIIEIIEIFYMEVEEIQIKNAYKEGYNDCSLGRFADSEKYYNETYTNENIQN